MKRGLMLAAVIILLMTAAPMVALADDGGQPIYDGTVSPLPGNLPSVGAEAYAFREFGDEVTFARTARNLKQVVVTLSSWACQTGHWYDGTCVTTPGATFSIPITFTIYSVGPNDTVGAVLATQTQTFDVPYRPSSDSVNCSGGPWFDAKSDTCFNGLAYDISFSFVPLRVQLPDAVIYGISYDTSHYGPNPIGDSAACYTSSGGCPYDSLNIALSPQVVVGSQVHPGTVFQNSPYGGEYCDNGAAGVNTFRLDSPTSACWTGYVPAVEFTASSKAADGGD